MKHKWIPSFNPGEEGEQHCEHCLLRMKFILDHPECPGPYKPIYEKLMADSDPVPTPEEPPTRGTLADREPHPAFASAVEWFQQQTPDDLAKWRESLASCAIEGNRLGEVCCETLDRIDKRQPISDRYFMGLILTLKHLKAPYVN